MKKFIAQYGIGNDSNCIEEEKHIIEAENLLEAIQEVEDMANLNCNVDNPKYSELYEEGIVDAMNQCANLRCADDEPCEECELMAMEYADNKISDYIFVRMIKEV